MSIFRTLWYFSIKPSYPIPVCDTDDIASVCKSLAPTILELESKIELDQFGHFLPVGGFSETLIFGTIGSYMQIGPGHGITVIPEHEFP